MSKEQIEDRLGKLSNDCNGIIGRLTMLRKHGDLAKECHTLMLKLGSDIDDLINELDS
jgi:hypothetical protein